MMSISENRTIKKKLMADYYLAFVVYFSIVGIHFNYIPKHAHVACDCIRLFDLFIFISFFLSFILERVSGNLFGGWTHNLKFCINTTWSQWPLQKRPFLVKSYACSLSSSEIYFTYYGYIRWFGGSMIFALMLAPQSPNIQKFHLTVKSFIPDKVLLNMTI